MGMTFDFDLRGDPKQKLKEIKAAAKRKEVIFRGDEATGTFHKDFNVPILGKMRVLEGRYVVNGPQISITVNKLPPGYTWERVESELRGFVEKE